MKESMSRMNLKRLFVAFVTSSWIWLGQSQTVQYSSDLSGNLVQKGSATGGAPQITGQPKFQIVAPGDYATFSVLLSDGAGCAYQWLFFGTNLSGQTGDSLLVTSVTAANQGPYSVVITNSVGSVTSLVAQLYLDSNGNGLPDSWELANFGNLNQTALGDFDGDGVPNLQEFLDGTNPADKTSYRSRLTLFGDGGLTAATPAQSSYAQTDIVSIAATPFVPNAFYGWAGDLVTRSNPAALLMNTNKLVRACFLCQAPVFGLVGWWRGEGDVSDPVGNHNGAFYSGTNALAASVTSTGMVGSAFVFYGTNFISIPDASALKPVQLTLEAWVFPTIQSGNYQTIIARGSAVNDDDAYYLGVLNGTPYFWTKTSGSMSSLAGGALLLNQWSHVAATFDGAVKRLYVNGILVGVQGGLGPLTYDPLSAPITIGSDWVANGPQYLFNGLLDEVSIFNRALSAFEINGIYSANCAGKCAARPMFAIAPQFPDAIQGTAYNQQISTLLGAPPVNYSLSAGALPVGLSLSASGQISGVPAATGSNVFAVRATDSVGVSTELICGVLVRPALVAAMPAGLVSWWRAENNTLDSIGSNPGAFRNTPAFATGQVGQALLLDGFSNAVDIADSASLRPASFTIEGWVSCNAVDGLRVMFAKAVGPGYSDSFAVWLENGNLRASIGDASSSGPTFTSGWSPVPGQWYHLAFSFDDNTKQQALYLNGVQVGIAYAPRSMVYDSHPLMLGRDDEFSAPKYFFGGLIDEVGFYNRALGVDEIAAIYNAGSVGKVASGPYFNSPPFPDGVVGVAYSQTLSTIQGAAPVSFAVSGSGLPPGLSLSPSGVLAGTPTAAGMFHFNLTATDASSLSNTQSFTLGIYASLPPAGGIVGWWRAENNALDSAGTNQGALINGATFAAGKVGQAFALDGNNQSVDIADAPSLHPASLTIEAWVLADYSSGLRHIFAKPLGSGTFDSFGIYVNSGTLVGFICDTNGFGPGLSVAFPSTPATWHHVAYTFDDLSKQQALYLDGAQAATGFVNKSIAYDNQPLLLGRDTENGNPNFFWPGRIDEAAIYNRALSAAEVAALYNAGSAGKTSAGPYITTAPTLPDALVGTPYNQSVTDARASGSAGFSVAGGTLPPGLTLSASGSLSGTPTAAGAYTFTLRVTDATAFHGDEQFTLLVNPRVVPPAGIAAWWRAENNGLDSVGTNNAILINATSFAPGKVGQAFQLSGANDALKIPDAPQLRPASVTLEAWVMFLSPGGLQAIFEKPLGGGTVDSYALALVNGYLDGAVADNSGFGPDLTAPFSPNPGQWYHVAYTFDDASKQQTLYLNGVPVNTGFSSKTIAYDSQALELGRDIENGYPNYFLAGRIDEAAVYGRALSAAEIAAIYNSGSSGKAAVAPYLNSSPTLPPGAVSQPYSQTFTSARGTGSVTYSISSGTLPLGLALNSSGTLTGVPTTAGSFQFVVRVTDSTGLFGEQTCTLRISAQVPPPSGLISWWRAEGDGSDAAGTNNGILRNGVSFAPGVSGQAFALDGIDTSVDILDSPSLRPASVTLETWVLFNNSGTRIIMGKPVGTGTSDSYQIYLSGGTLGAFVGDAYGSGGTLAIPFSPVLGQWYHVAYTFDDLTRQQVLYLNGVNMASGLGSKAIGYDSSPVLLGRDIENGAPAFFLQGRLDEAAIYDRALSAGEVLSIYQAGPAGKTTAGPYFATHPSLPNAILAQPYSQTISAVRGAGAVAFSVVGGVLPPGLGLTSGGLLSGIPSGAGVFSFSVRATDAAALSVDQVFTLVVFAPFAAPPGLAAWWRGENNASDSAGTNNGVLSNTVNFVTGKVGSAFNFDGVSANVQVPNPSSFLNPSGPFTVELWERAAPQQFTADGLFLLVDKSHGWTDGSGWAFQGNTGSGGVSFFYGIGGGSSGVNFIGAATQGGILDNRWHHLAGVFNGSQILLYEDAVLQNATTLTNLPAPNSRGVEFGRSWGGGSPTRYFHGQLDEISYYNRALSAAEVAGIYSAGPAGKSVGGIPPIVLSAYLQNNALVFSFATAPGTAYTVDYTDALGTGVWTPLTTLNAAGSVLLYTNPVAIPQQRFFRVRTTN